MSGLFVIVFGFPAAFFSLLISALGILREKYGLVILGAILFVPFSYYLSGAPGSAGLPLLLPVFQVGSALAVRENKNRWAWILFAPALLVTLWVLGVALVYNRPR